jgi:hypothetical protein
MYHVYNTIGTRSPGSEGERKGADFFKDEYQKWTDEVNEDNFTASPQAYPAAMIKPLGWFYLISIVFFFIFPPVSLLVVIPMLLWVLELFGLKRAVDKFYPKKKSQNIYAKIHSVQPAKAIMVFAGHNDSPNCFPFTAKYRKKAMDMIMAVFAIAIIYILFVVVRIIWSLATNNIFFPQYNQGFLWVDWFGIMGAAVAPMIFYITQVFVSKKKSFGANDNLSGAVTALTLARYFHDHRPENIELWFIAFGCEEVGERGSTDFVLKHKQELLDKDAYVVNLECTGGGNILLLATSETMCIPPVKHHPEVYNLLKDASRKVMIRRQTIRSDLTQGYTDAEAFSRHGVKASSIVGLMVDGFPMLWHIETDTPDNLHPGCMRDVMEIAIKAVEMRETQLSTEMCASGNDSEIPCEEEDFGYSWKNKKKL